MNGENATVNNNSNNSSKPKSQKVANAIKIDIIYYDSTVVMSTYKHAQTTTLPRVVIEDRRVFLRLAAAEGL